MFEAGEKVPTCLVSRGSLHPEPQLPKDLREALLDRDLVLYEANVIMEYLDERFPHPPLLPVYPVQRAL